MITRHQASFDPHVFYQLTSEVRHIDVCSSLDEFLDELDVSVDGREVDGHFATRVPLEHLLVQTRLLDLLDGGRGRGLDWDICRQNNVQASVLRVLRIVPFYII